MTTTVVKTIGTGGDYSTIQAWEDAAPANLVTVDQIWQGQCKNQTFTESVAISGSTSDSTRYKELTTEAGASFSDNASVQTNALRYNTANGAAITRGTAWTTTLANAEAYARVSKLQIAATNVNTIAYTTSTSTTSVDKCIIEYNSTGGANTVYLYGGATIKNSLVVCRASSAASAIISLRNGSAAYNFTFVSSVSTASNGVYGQYAASTVKNCAVFGATTFGTGTAATCTTSYSSAGSLPSGVTSAAFDTSTGSGFENITDATRDFRIKSTSALINAATTDSTNAPVDIAGTSRPSGASYDVGAWEYMSAGGDASVTLTGASATSGVGSLVATGTANIALTGAAATTSIGAITGDGAGNTALTGATSTASVGTITAFGHGNVTLTGASATAYVGAITATGGSSGAGDATLVGSQATASAGALTASGNASVTLSGASASSGVGTITARVHADALMTGAQATAAFGSLIAKGDASVLLAGAQANSYAGSITAVGGGSGVAVYPSASTVLAGVSYGPTGVEYTGTYALSAASIAAQVRTELAAELLRITEVAKIHGLVQGVNLVVTPTSRTAGDVVQTISGDGVSSSTVSRA